MDFLELPARIEFRDEVQSAATRVLAGRMTLTYLVRVSCSSLIAGGFWAASLSNTTLVYVVDSHDVPPRCDCVSTGILWVVVQSVAVTATAVAVSKVVASHVICRRGMTCSWIVGASAGFTATLE